ncbi:FAD-dependent thymidylate synthase [Desulfoplanes formicivorans]|uniref:FAD-dependent thymidylate synthase n=1 Tax=Desulfoplanes formicivorans TaxID=1592317 RepID=A0A194AE14_9BACT|nr:FAD-dependent thymidylate synthase [Desulfoplanes formicivorans]GAU07440.1 thymidylate synthase [Desulfoplanes formicivorans]
MRIVEPSYTILQMPDGEQILAHLERAARTCYKSEDKITEGSARKLIARILQVNHESVLEHASVSVRIVCDRGISHEIVRHRLASFSQESTRYANYGKEKFGKEITVIRPFFWEEDSREYALWLEAMEKAEEVYMALLEAGARPQEARSVLPNSLKTEIVVTANLREWRHIFKLRCASAAHPQIRQIMLPMLASFHERIPVVFDDVYATFRKDMAQV